MSSDQEKTESLPVGEGFWAWGGRMHRENKNSEEPCGGQPYAAYAYTPHYEQNILRSVDEFIIPVRVGTGNENKKLGNE